MFGEIGAWFYKALGGINIDENQPGFKNTLLQPHFVKDLEDFKASHKAPFGTIISEWKRVGETVVYTVVVPPNSTAELIFDDAVKQVSRKGQNEVFGLNLPIKLEAGKYEFVIK